MTEEKLLESQGIYYELNRARQALQSLRINQQLIEIYKNGIITNREHSVQLEPDEYEEIINCIEGIVLKRTRYLQKQFDDL